MIAARTQYAKGWRPVVLGSLLTTDAATRHEALTYKGPNRSETLEEPSWITCLKSVSIRCRTSGCPMSSGLTELTEEVPGLEQG